MDKHNWEFRNTLFLSHLPPPCPSFPLMKKKKKKSLKTWFVAVKCLYIVYIPDFFVLHLFKFLLSRSDHIIAIFICFLSDIQKAVITFFFPSFLWHCFAAMQYFSQGNAWVLVPLKKVAIELNISTKIQHRLLHELVLIWKPQRKYIRLADTLSTYLIKKSGITIMFNLKVFRTEHVT